MKLLCIVVLYNRELLSTEAYRTLLIHASGKPDIKIFAYDNSSSKSPLTEKYEEMGVVYKWNPDNGGVSKAYNSGARFAQENGFDRLLLLDQDTRWGEENYLEVLDKSISDNPEYDIFVPEVIYDRGVFSPLECKGFRPRHKSLKPGMNTLRNVAIVNTGLSVTTDLFMRSGGYNENVTLDFADFQFVGRLRKQTDKFFLIDYRCHQDFSDSSTDKNSLRSRFKIYCQCLRNYECESDREKYRLMLAGFAHSAKLSVRTLDPGFILHYLRIFNTSEQI